MDSNTETVKKGGLQREELKQAQRKAAKPLLYVGIVSIVMLFAGLTSAYVVRADNGNWLVFQLPGITILSTALIVSSSFSMLLAQMAIKKNNYSLTSLALLVTLILGVAFFFTQYEGWKQLTAQGIYFIGKYSNASGSFLYLIALVHLAHMVGGILALLVSFTKSLLKRYSSANYLGLELTAIYWHFLDLLWVYLFLFLYFYR
ncbi:MAG: cytochrome c oxidase subunit 3 [Bacteroidia bacterium]|jgi:cytochrome c oxidase subunit 3|nr:cytochrome c oxidase subunit 3 [Bacteroidia bacterium]